MITIPVKELRKFISRSSFVTDSKMLPVYGYVKLVCKKEGSSIIKHNGNKFIVFDITAEFTEEQSLLIDTHTLFGLVKESKGEEMTISLEGNNVHITDGIEKVYCQSIKDLYPSVESNKGAKKFEISTDVRDALLVAKKHTSSSVAGWMEYVHLKKIKEKYYVIGTRGEVTYFKGFSSPLPEISLSIDCVGVLESAIEYTYSLVGNYDYFETVGALYGFLKPETKCSDSVELVLERFHSDKCFEIERRPIIDFCKMILAMNNSSVPPEVSFEGSGKNDVVLRFVGVGNSQGSDKKLPVENKTFKWDSILFQPKNVLTVLDSISFEKVKISYTHSNFVITAKEDENYIGAMMQLAN